MRYEELTGYSLAGIGERDPGRINKPVIPREGFPATLQGLNRRMPPVTPPEMFPGTLTSGSGGHAELAISSIIPRLTSLAGIGQRNFRRTALPIIPREGFPSTLLAGLNVRQPPVTPPEMFPRTLTPGSAWLGGLDTITLMKFVGELFKFDPARAVALAIGWMTYKNMSIVPAFLISMAAPQVVREIVDAGIVRPTGENVTKVADGVAAVIAGLIAIGGGGFF